MLNFFTTDFIMYSFYYFSKNGNYFLIYFYIKFCYNK